jgi:hypothetical protein
MSTPTASSSLGWRAAWRSPARSRPSRNGAVALGGGVFLLVALAVAAASAHGSPLRAGAPELSDLPAAVYVAAVASAFATYVAALVLVRRRGLPVLAACAVAAAIQLVPLAGPLLLSRDVYAYWAYGRETEVHASNPYSTPPDRFPHDPAERSMAPAWRTADSVYGPVFTGASAGLADATGRSAEDSALAYRLLAAAGMLALVGVAACAAARPAFAAAFVGWNPLLALQFAGGGHNDVWTAVFLLGAIALAARGRGVLSGGSWAVAAGLKWTPVVLLPFELLARRRHARAMAVGFLLAVVAIAVAAVSAFGTAWLGALLPFTHRRAAYAIPSRLETVGLPGWLALAPLALALPWLVRSARRGRPRRALLTALLLAASPWLLPWYAVWIVPLAAVEDDRLAWIVALALTAYLLPDRVPL